MSEQNTIPQNNLPIYLQNYTVSILGNIYPVLIVLFQVYV